MSELKAFNGGKKTTAELGRELGETLMAEARDAAPHIDDAMMLEYTQQIMEYLRQILAAQEATARAERDIIVAVREMTSLSAFLTSAISFRMRDTKTAV